MTNGLVAVSYLANLINLDLAEDYAIGHANGQSA